MEYISLDSKPKTRFGMSIQKEIKTSQNMGDINYII